MKKISAIFIALTAAVVLLTVGPKLYNLLTAKPEGTPFTLYSCVLHDFTALYQEDRDYKFVDRAGNVYSDEVQPLFYASILASRGALPDSLEGQKVTLEEIERNNMFLTMDPRDVNKVIPPVYLLMESVPERLELQDPKEAFVSRKDGLYIYNMAQNALQEEKTEKLNGDLRALGFVFPAKCIEGNPTDRKDHDEGYLLTDDERCLILTEKGRKCAEEVIQRYEFFRTLLLRLGIPAQTAEQDACRLEHAVCPESFGALKACFYLISEVNQ